MIARFKLRSFSNRMDFESVVRHATLVVQQDMASNDPSHDFLHVQRVQNLALQIARREGVEDLQLVHVDTRIGSCH
jgi:HD superfamily phosphodiesterase